MRFASISGLPLDPTCSEKKRAAREQRNPKADTVQAREELHSGLGLLFRFRSGISAVLLQDTKTRPDKP